MKHQNLQLAKFKLETIQELIEKYESKRSHVGRSLSPHPLRLTARYFPSLIPSNESSQTHLQEHIMFAVILNGP
jgi:hypothetical protein